MEGKNVPHRTKRKSNSVIRHRVHLHQLIANGIHGVLGVHVLLPVVKMGPDPEEEVLNRQLKMVAGHVIVGMLKMKVVVAKIAHLKMMIQNQNVSFFNDFFHFTAQWKQYR